MDRLRSLVGATLVLALLVLPPAISVGQEGTGEETTGEPPAAPSAPQPAPTPGGGGAGDQGTQEGGIGADAGSEAASDSAAPGAASVATVEAGAAKVGGRGRGLAQSAAAFSVSVGDNFYAPASISIGVGDTVTWTNNGQAPHSATANNGSFDTGVFNSGQSRSHTFNSPGSFSYYCTVHGQAQSGTVTVASSSGGGGGGGGGGGSGPSEAAAVASADAAGSSTSLPSTGSDVLPAVAVGLLLLAAGGVLRLRDLIGSA